MRNKFLLFICHPVHGIIEKWKKSLSCVRVFATPWTVAYQAPPSMGSSRQENRSGLPLLFFLYGLPPCFRGKESTCNAGDTGSVFGLGRSPGEGKGNPLQCSCLENPRDRGAWWAIVFVIAKRTWLNNWTHTYFSCTLSVRFLCLHICHLYTSFRPYFY